MIRNLLLSAAAALGALSMGATEASAQWGHHGGHHGVHHSGHHGVQLGVHHGGHHSSHYGGYHTLPSYSSLYSGGLGYNSGFQVRRPVYHDTTHLDYHGRACNDTAATSILCLVTTTYIARDTSTTERLCDRDGSRPKSVSDAVSCVSCRFQQRRWWRRCLMCLGSCGRTHHESARWHLADGAGPLRVAERQGSSNRSHRR